MSSNSQLLKDVVKRHVLDTLSKCGHNVPSAARSLGVTKMTVYNMLNRWNIPYPGKK